MAWKWWLVRHEVRGRLGVRVKSARQDTALAQRRQSSYNDYMPKPRSTVGSRELKTRLGQYLERVRRGETILVTDRNVPVAELRPVGHSGDPLANKLRTLAAEGAVTLPSRKGLTRVSPVRSRGLSASEAVSRDRDERG